MANGSGPAEDPSLSGALRAAEMLSAGDARGALAAAGEACHEAPRQAATHYVRGQAAMALGETSEAERAFRAAIQIQPGWAEPWVNLGLVRYAQGSVGHAINAMRHALKLAPGHAAASANLGAFLRITGHHEASETLLRDALARDPAQPAVRLNLVAELMGEGRAADALALLDAAPVPDDVDLARQWHLGRALALAGTGRPGEARDALTALDALGPVPSELAPLRQWRLVMIALAEGDRAGAEAAAEAMEGMLDAMGPAAVPEHRIMAHYDLAKLWSGIGETARAFAHWTAGHALLREIQPFSREAEAGFSAAAVARFTPERFAAGPRASNDDPAPVFIVGLPRSGTTLCEQIIAAHTEAHGAGERMALGQLCRRLAGGDTPEGVARIDALPREALDAAAAGYLAELHALAPGAARVVDKMPGNARYVWLIALLFPGAKIIHCTRDPRDIGLSIFTYRFHGEHGYAHDLADLGWSIAETERLMRHWAGTLPNPVLTVRLDDWVADFDGTLERVLAHLDLPSDPNCARFHEATTPVRTASRSQVRRPINARGLGRWRAHAEDLAPLIAELERGGALDAWRDRPGAAPDPGGTPDSTL